MISDRVSDHAVLRFMQRVLGVDVEAVRSHIAVETQDAILTGARSLKRDQIRYVFDGGTVVTVTLTPKQMRKQREGHHG